MTEPNQKLPDSNSPANLNADDRLVDPLDLVYKGGYSKNPREIVETPGATPERLDDQAPEDLRSDLMDDESDERI